MPSFFHTHCHSLILIGVPSPTYFVFICFTIIFFLPGLSFYISALFPPEPHASFACSLKSRGIFIVLSPTTQSSNPTDLLMEMPYLLISKELSHPCTCSLFVSNTHTHTHTQIYRHTPTKIPESTANDAIPCAGVWACLAMLQTASKISNRFYFHVLFAVLSHLPTWCHFHTKLYHYCSFQPTYQVRHD